MWTAFAIGWVMISLPVLAFVTAAHIPEKMVPRPNAIPDAEFEKLYLYARQEVFLDALASRIALFPETEGRACALEHLAIERAENVSRLLATEAVV